MMLVRESLFEDYKYFKGKSNEEVEKSLEELSLEERFIKGVKNNMILVVSECIQKGINPASADNWAIHYASVHGYANMVKLLLKYKKVDPRATYNIAIYYASTNNHIEVVKILLDDGRVNIKEKLDDMTTLDSVIINNRNDILKLFLEHPYSRKQLNKKDIERIQNHLNNID